MMRDLAERLVAYEARRKPPEAPVFHVCEKLRPHLTKLMGNGGYFALCSRALALASADVIWLKAISIRPGGVLQAAQDERTKLAPKELTEGQVVLVARLLGLLATFIGEDLMLHLLSEVWPDLNLSRGGRK